MPGKLDGKRVAFLFTDGVEQAELEGPLEALRSEGAQTTLVSIESGDVQAFNHLDRGHKFKADAIAKDSDSSHFDALVLPGGVANPDRLRMDTGAVKFVKGFVEEDKPVGVICHGPWTLVEADVLHGRTLTSWPSLQTDIRNAGATWVDEQVHVDGHLVSSRKPDDIPSFNKALVEVFADAA